MKVGDHIVGKFFDTSENCWYRMRGCVIKGPLTTKYGESYKIQWLSEDYVNLPNSVWVKKYEGISYILEKHLMIDVQYYREQRLKKLLE